MIPLYSYEIGTECSVDTDTDTKFDIYLSTVALQARGQGRLDTNCGTTRSSSNRAQNFGMKSARFVFVLARSPVGVYVTPVERKTTCIRGIIRYGHSRLSLVLVWPGTTEGQSLGANLSSVLWQ